MSETTQTRQDAVDHATQSYQELREYIDGIAETDMLEPNKVGVWSGRDVILHFAAWETRAAELLEEMAAGNPKKWLPDGVDMDEWNLERVAEYGDVSLKEAQTLWADAHQKMIDTYMRLDIDAEDVLLGITREHYREHYPDFRHIKPFKPLSDEDRAALVEQMEQSHRDFLQLIESISDERLLAENTVGDWSGKDLIAHLGHWQEAGLQIIRDLEAGKPGKWPYEAVDDLDQWNEERMATARDMSLQEARQFQQRAFDDLLDAVKTSPKATRAAGIGATQFHYDIHREDFQRVAEAG